MSAYACGWRQDDGSSCAVIVPGDASYCAAHEAARVVTLRAAYVGALDDYHTPPAAVSAARELQIAERALDHAAYYIEALERQLEQALDHR